VQKAQENWRGNTAFCKVVNDLFQVRCAGISLDGADDQISLPVYIEVASAPVFDSISFERLLDCRGQLAVSCLLNKT
jgi:hypothetical protein